MSPLRSTRRGGTLITPVDHRAVIVVGLTALGALAACSGGPAVGEEGAPCPNDFNCRPQLYCDDGFCAPRPRDGGVEAPRDAGVRDAGLRDAGIRDAGEIDAGPRDAGCPTPPTLSQIQSRVFGAAGQPSCNQNTCHGVAEAGGIRLDTPVATLRASLLGPTAAQQAPERNIVVPGDPDASRLVTIIEERNPGGGGGPMPPTGPLNACDVESIRQWISDGALAN